MTRTPLQKAGLEDAMGGLWSLDGCGQNCFEKDPILVGLGEFTTRFLEPTFSAWVGMFAGGTTWIF